MKQGLCDWRSHLGWVVFSSRMWTIPEHPWHSQEWDSSHCQRRSCLLAAVETFFGMVSHQSGTAWELFFLSFPSLVLGVNSSFLSHSDTTVLKCQRGLSDTEPRKLCGPPPILPSVSAGCRTIEALAAHGAVR